MVGIVIPSLEETGHEPGAAVAGSKMSNHPRPGATGIGSNGANAVAG